MSGSKVNNYSTTFTSLTWMQLAIDYARPGYNAIELTNMSTTAKPNIGAGSLCECGGALYQFSTEEPISTAGISTTDQTYFVELVPSSSQCTAQFSTIVPTYRTDYHGYYLNSTSNHRNIGACRIDTGNYNYKYKYIENSDRTNFSVGCSNPSTVIYSTLTTSAIYYDNFKEWSSVTHTFTPIEKGTYIFIIDIALYSTVRSAASTYNVSGMAEGMIYFNMSNVVNFFSFTLTPSSSITWLGLNTIRYQYSIHNSVSLTTSNSCEISANSFSTFSYYQVNAYIKVKKL